MKKTAIFVITILIPILCVAQSYHISENKDSKEILSKNDFSNIFSVNDILGYIGDGQRLYIHFDKINKDSLDSSVYHVIGESRVKENVCTFAGDIKIKSIKKTPNNYYNLNRYTLSASYYFKEKQCTYGTGQFIGRVKSMFFCYNDSVYYDEIECGADSYCNNQFEGVWKSYKTNLCKKANFGINRIPNSDFLDVGSDEFRVNDKYISKGWKTFVDAQNHSNSNLQMAIAEESREWWLKDKETKLTWKTNIINDTLCVCLYRNSQYVQTIKEKFSEDNKDSTFYIYQNDYDFDGERDVEIILGDCEFYSLYCWRPLKGIYEKNLSYSSIESPMLTEDEKSIIANKIENDQFIFSHYQLHNGMYIKVSSVRVISRENLPDLYSEKEYNDAGEIIKNNDSISFSALSPFWKGRLFYASISSL